MVVLKSTNSIPNSIQLSQILAKIHADGLKRDMEQYADCLEHLRNKDRQSALLHRSPSRAAIKQSLADSIGDWNCTWDIDLALTLPSNHPASHAPNHKALSAFLVGYFSRVEADIFSHQSRRQRSKLIRYVVLEHADGVGWHSHAIIASPAHLDVTTTNNVMRRHWYKSVGTIRNKNYDPNRLYWSDIHQHDYIAYSLKHAIQTSNCNLDMIKGTMCEFNTIPPN